jgi:hypothetical protein
MHDAAFLLPVHPADQIFLAFCIGRLPGAGLQVRDSLVLDRRGIRRDNDKQDSELYFHAGSEIERGLDFYDFLRGVLFINRAGQLVVFQRGIRGVADTVDRSLVCSGNNFMQRDAP